MESWIDYLLTVLCAVLASSGFWACIQKWRDKHNANTRLLVGIAHDIIVNRGLFYLERGDWITRDEYENLHDYLYEPYREQGGNGSAERVMNDINSKLRLVEYPPVFRTTTKEHDNDLQEQQNL